MLQTLGLAGLGTLAWTAGTPNVAHAPGGRLDVRSHGARGDGATDDTQAFISGLQSAAGGTLHVPAGTYLITSTLYISAAKTCLAFERGATLLWKGGDKSCIIVAGEDVAIYGGEIRAGYGAVASNKPWDRAVIEARGSARRLHVSNIKLVGVPRVGIGVRSDGAQISDCVILGETPEDFFTGSETVHFGIAYDPPEHPSGGSFSATGNHIEKCVQGICLGNAGSGRGTCQVIAGNIFHQCWNHGVYQSIGLDNSTISGNSFFECQCPIAVTGRNNVVSANACYTNSKNRPQDWAGIGLRNAENCIVSDNTITGDISPSSVAIGIEGISPDADIRGNTVNNNVIDAGGSSGNPAIRIGGPNSGRVVGNIVAGNSIRGGGSSSQGMITITASQPTGAFANEVRDNVLTLSTPSYGISVENATATRITGNTLIEDQNSQSAQTRVGIACKSTSVNTLVHQNRFLCPAGKGANLTLQAVRLEGTAARVSETEVTASGYTQSQPLVSTGTGTAVVTLGAMTPRPASTPPQMVARIAVTDGSGKPSGYIPVYAHE